MTEAFIDDEMPDEADDAAPGGELVRIGDFLEGVDKWSTDVAEDAAVHTLKLGSRALPSSLDTERAVLGGIILDGTSLDHAIDAGLEAEHFFRPAHQVVYRAIMQVHEAGEPVGTITLVQALERAQQLDQVGGAAAIAQLEAMLPTSAHVGSYARIIVGKAMQRRMIEVAQEIVADAFKGKQHVEHLVDSAVQSLSRIHIPHKSGFRAELARARKDLERAGIRRREWEGPIATKTIKDLHHEAPPPVPWIVRGLVRERALIVLGGEPKGGKTWDEDELAIAVASRTKAFGEFAVEVSGPVMMLLLEEDRRDVNIRMNALTHNRGRAVREATGLIHYEARLSIDLLDVDDCAGIVASARAMPNLPVLICIDPLRDANSGEENSNDDMSRVMHRGRAIRDVTGATVLLTHHMTKPQQTRPTTTPVPGGIFNRFRGAGALRAAWDAGIGKDTRFKSPNCIKSFMEVETRGGRAAGLFGLQLDIEDGPDDNAKAASWTFYRNAPDMFPKQLGKGELDDGANTSGGPILTDPEAVVLSALRTEHLKNKKHGHYQRGLRLSEVATKTKMSSRSVTRHLSNLADDHKLVMRGGNGWLYIEPTSEADDA